MTTDMKKLRNIGIIAHIDAGKTTTTERILFFTGLTHKIGSVDDGNTTTDYLAQERERGITIVSAAVTTEWKGHQLNIIDTPGHIDFTVEVQRSLRVLDGAVVVFDAVNGVEAQSETVWRQASEFGVPKICFVNKMDKIGSDYYNVIKDINEKFGMLALEMQVPLYENRLFYGVVDLLSLKAYSWNENGQIMSEIPIPLDMITFIENKRHQLIETVVEYDDSILSRYLDGNEIDMDEIRSLIRKLTIMDKAVPVYAGSSKSNKGIQLVLDGIVDYLPAPSDRMKVHAYNEKGDLVPLKSSEDEDFVGLVFKNQTDTFGVLYYCRIYSGKIQKSDVIYNTRTKTKMRIGNIILMKADSRVPVEQASAGDIIALVNLKDTATGDTICSPDNVLTLESIDFPEPIVSASITPQTQSDNDKLVSLANLLMKDDPTLRIRFITETGQLIVEGMGELHLEIFADRLRTEHNVNIVLGKPLVEYLITIARKVTGIQGIYKHQSGGRGQFGHVVLDVEPGERNSGILFENKITQGKIPSEYFSPIEKSIRQTSESINGYKLIDIKVSLVDGSFHEVDSSSMAFEFAASIGLKDAITKAGIVYLEPMMASQIITPSEYMGNIMGSVVSRRGNVEQMTLLNDTQQKVDIMIPLSETFGYVSELRSLSSGRAIFNMQFDHYAPVNIKYLQEK